jgi:hypothetical protein
MLKRILLPALLGFVTLAAWTFVVNGIFRFNARLALAPPPDEAVVWQMLGERIVEAGVYVANPSVVPEVGFPPGEPVFGITYAGFGHEAAPRTQLMRMAVGILSMLLAATLLATTAPAVRSRYLYRVLFIVGLGVLLALLADVTKIGIGGYPVRTGLLFAANRVAQWTLVGVVMALATRAPDTASSAGDTASAG